MTCWKHRAYSGDRNRRERHPAAVTGLVVNSWAPLKSLTRRLQSSRNELYVTTPSVTVDTSEWWQTLICSSLEFHGAHVTKNFSHQPPWHPAAPLRILWKFLSTDRHMSWSLITRPCDQVERAVTTLSWVWTQFEANSVGPSPGPGLTLALAVFPVFSSLGTHRAADHRTSSARSPVPCCIPFSPSERAAPSLWRRTPWTHRLPSAGGFYPSLCPCLCATAWRRLSNIHDSQHVTRAQPNYSCFLIECKHKNKVIWQFVTDSLSLRGHVIN